mgnify:FL=1
MSLQINPENLRQHSQKVTRIADDVADVAKLSRNTVNGGDFGLFCSFMVPGLTMLSSLAESVLATAHEALNVSAASLRTVAETVEASDADAARQLSAIQEQLPNT